jgi:hypothetical protein
MAKTKVLQVTDLMLDLKNYRTVPQKSEADAIRAMISINPSRFWALMESLLSDGYHPTENILILDSGENMIVREGNRRIAAMKLILGHLKRSKIELPGHIEDKINGLTADWKAENSGVPCAIYAMRESATVDRIVALTHGKGEQAGRDTWNAVARARHNRDSNLIAEPALDLLEKYLLHGKNLTSTQKERWSGDYPLSVLDEAIKRVAPRVDAKSVREFADQYPAKTAYRNSIESVLNDVGTGDLDFKVIRSAVEDWAAVKYGFPLDTANSSKKANGKPSAKSNAASNSSVKKAGTASASNTKSKAVATNDPKSVMRALRAFAPSGPNRDKLVTLIIEARSLSLEKHPHAFCFLLRSMFEISAKAYCKDHEKKSGPAAIKADSTDRTLVDVLRDISNHLSKNQTDKAMQKLLHGAIAELAKPSGFLSVTSLNQLVHNPKFTVDETHIATLFGNVFPLLEEMNR